MEKKEKDSSREDTEVPGEETEEVDTETTDTKIETMKISWLCKKEEIGEEVEAEAEAEETEAEEEVTGTTKMVKVNGSIETIERREVIKGIEEQEVEDLPRRFLMKVMFKKMPNLLMKAVKSLKLPLATPKSESELTIYCCIISDKIWLQIKVVKFIWKMPLLEKEPDYDKHKLKGALLSLFGLNFTSGEPSMTFQIEVSKLLRRHRNVRLDIEISNRRIKARWTSIKMIYSKISAVTI